MNYLASCINKLKSEAGFSLLEMLLVIIISSFMLSIFINTALNLYQDYSFFNLQNAWQLDVYLAADFISNQIQNSQKIEIISKSEIDIYSFYDGDYQWFKFCSYQADDQQHLGRAIGNKDFKTKDFGKHLSLLDNIKKLNFKIIRTGLLEIIITVEDGKRELTVSKLIKII